MDQVRTSKFLSLILRHKPEEAGIVLDESGWCRVEDMLNGCAKKGFKISREELDILVADNVKASRQNKLTLLVK
jgi:putative RNA 2'-phosphotransferase